MGNLWLNIGEGADVFGCRIRKSLYLPYFLYIFHATNSCLIAYRVAYNFVKYTRRGDSRTR